MIWYSPELDEIALITLSNFSIDFFERDTEQGFSFCCSSSKWQNYYWYYVGDL